MSSEIQEKGFLFGERTLSNIVPAVLPVIPIAGFGEVLLDFGRKNQLNGHGDCESCAGFHAKRVPRPDS